MSAYSLMKYRFLSRQVINQNRLLILINKVLFKTGLNQDRSSRQVINLLIQVLMKYRFLSRHQEKNKGQRSIWKHNIVQAKQLLKKYNSPWHWFLNFDTLQSH